MSKEIIAEAVKDAKDLRKAALESARNEIIEKMTPRLRSMLDEAVRGAFSGKREDVDRLRRGVQDNWPGESHTNFEESKDQGDQPMDKELDMEGLAAFFPQISEEPEGAPGIPTLGEEPDFGMDDMKEPQDEAKKKAAEDEEGPPAEDEVGEEEIEISEAELRKVYETALQTEASVTKGFGEMTKSGELDDVIKDVDKGLADVKKGESNWEKAEPPAKQDFTVKEAIEAGRAENRALRENLKKAVRVVKTLAKTLHEVNLFNAKVMHVNRILSRNGGLTKEQRTVVLESIDKARSIEQVKMVYETITRSFKATGRLAEGRNARKPAANAQRARTSGAPKTEVLRESVDRANNDGQYDRLRELAGLTNK